MIDRHIEHPVQYVSKALQDAETRYPEIEKLALALIVSARKLRPYFQAHTVVVLTNQPLRQVLQKPETSGRLIKWAIELGEFDIKYKPRPSIKAQALADFISEFTGIQPLADWPDVPETSTNKGLRPNLPLWTLHVDGASNQHGCGAGLVLKSPEKDELKYAVRFEFKASNNEAEYEALLAGLRVARQLGVRQLHIFCDSQLVVGQVTEEYQAREHNMSTYLSKVKELLESFLGYEITQIPREENALADSLARLASAPELDQVRAIPVEILKRPSIEGGIQEVLPIISESSWMDPIYDYLAYAILPNDRSSVAFTDSIS